MLTRLTRDVWHFSAAKNYQQLRDFTLALKDENGNIRTFNEFKEAATAINSKFNGTWLKTEYDQAIGSSIMASKWNNFLKEAKTMPYLKYSTVGDERVRDEHARLEGIIRKITDIFWQTHYPPNGWKCRCDAEQLTASFAKETENIPDVPIPTLFQTNLAESGLIYPKGHPYYDGVPTDVLRRSISYLPKDAPFKDVYHSPESGKKVSMHLLHGLDEMSQNVKTSKLLADAGYNVKLLPVLGENDNDLRQLIYGTKDYVKGKNPDVLLNNKILADIKNTENVSKTAIHNAVRKGAKQADNIIIHLPGELPEATIKRYVKGQLAQTKYADKVYIIDGTGKTFEYDRKILGLAEKAKRPTK